MAKKKSEMLADALAELLQGSSDIDGAAIVGVDGLVYSANVPQRALDENMVGATSAAVLGLSKRSVQQLKRGGFSQTLIQGDDGNIIVSSLNADTLFVGLTPKNVNLGMAFAEVRSMTAKLSEIL
jgi:predicted regulator of Ras-like GTPase activity (Roadblock/LC7/MglB family)